MKLNALKVAVGLLVLAVGSFAAGNAPMAAEWNWTLAPYFWAAGVSTDLEVNDEPVLMSNADFGDILDKTDIAGMIHFEGRKGKAGFFVDALFLGLGEDSTINNRPPVPSGTEADADMSVSIFEVGGIWRPSGGDHGFDLLFGARSMGIDVEVDLTLPSSATTTVGGDDNYTDVFVGGRFSRPFKERWNFIIRGDLGTGDTDLSWNAVGTLGVKFGEGDRYGVQFGYRHMELDFENDDDDVKVETTIKMSGPIAGFVFNW